MIVLPDYLLNKEELFNRKKIINFSNVKAICIYFKVESGFTTTPELDYAEISDTFNFNLLIEIMTKEVILKGDLWNLILLFDNLTFVNKEDDLTTSIIYQSLNFNELYFSVENR